MKSITDYIPIGHRNAISRARLREITGLSDRKVRKAISDAGIDTAIVNMQNGDGYFIPDPMDAEDVRLLQQYLYQEDSRIRNLMMRSSGANYMLLEIQQREWDR